MIGNVIRTLFLNRCGFSIGHVKLNGNDQVQSKHLDCNPPGYFS